MPAPHQAVLGCVGVKLVVLVILIEPSMQEWCAMRRRWGTGLVCIGLAMTVCFSAEARRPGKFLVTNLDASGPGSLHQAVEDANVRPGRDRIEFKVNGTIHLDIDLELLDDSGVIINGFSHPPGPGITLEMVDYTLWLKSSNNEIRGLNIVGSGIEEDESLCVWVLGAPDEPSEFNVITQNRISNCYMAVSLWNANSNVIRDNTMISHGWGVFLWWFDGPNNDNVVEGNVIGMTASAIHIERGTGNIIRGNFLGVDREGNRIPNERGVSTGGSGGYITQCTVGPSNVIAFNNEQGVAIYEAATATTITMNSIFENGGGIFRNPASAFPPPTVLEANPISGLAQPQSMVEIFFDGGYEGRFLVGAVKADSAGNFTTALSVRGFAGNVTATATDADGNTSEFSVPTPTGQ